MKFKDYVYNRPDYEAIKKEYEVTCAKINEAKNYEDVIASVNEITITRKHISSMESLCSIRHSIDTNDEFYCKETDFFNEYGPLFAECENSLSLALYQSEFRSELEKYYGSYLFEMIKVQLEVFSTEIIPELQEEGNLITQYDKIIASAKIPFDGKVLNLSQMAPYMISFDRSVRKNAEEATWKFFEEHIDELDTIYDKLVKVRDTMAKKLGFKNFIPLGYKRLGRTEYDSSDVSTYRDQVYKELVPLATKIYDEQAKRLGIDDFKSYDMNLKFKTGNPQPLGDLDYKIKQATKMYNEMSEETSEFVNFMFEHENTDLLSKPGKQSGGYCTYIPDYESPFVFANFNGTSSDIEVLTHEFGHAFQVYSSRHIKVLDYIFPTLEACEIHSMSMEFFSWPWMELFFSQNDADKYRYQHMIGTIVFIPYGVLVDEYQHCVYEKPEMSIQERNECWRRLEKKYMPFKKYDNAFLEKGHYWVRQGHIFQTAFYYIDYTLAQNCAQQFWVKNQLNQTDAWNDYVRLCKTGGSKSFLELLKVANLENPFIEGSVKKVSEPLQEWFSKQHIE